MGILGQDIPRVDAVAKVTGGAHYTADLPSVGHLWAALVGSTIARGRILSINAPAGFMVLSFLNAPRLQPGLLFNPGQTQETGAAANTEPPFQSDRVVYHGQPVACVVAPTLEQAVAAADRVRVRYHTEVAAIDFSAGVASAVHPEGIWGKPAVQIHGEPDSTRSDVRIDRTYTTPIIHHTTMEPHATLAEWAGDRLTVHDSSRYVEGEARLLAAMFSLPRSQVRVISPLVGGAFGEKGAIRDHVPIAAMAARLTGRPVKLVLSRRQVTEMTGHRPFTQQRVVLGADTSGVLSVIIHEGASSCSSRDPFVEPFSAQTYKLYAAPHRRVEQKIVHLNASQPTTMRAPGEASGMFALESAMDELACELGIDPVQLRLRNEPSAEPVTGKPFSLRLLRECLEMGAAKFGWERRGAPVREGDWLIGMGMAAATYPFKGNLSHASCRVEADRVVIKSSTHEFGNAITTVIRQIVADTLGVDFGAVEFQFGDSSLPVAPISGGSTGTMWVGSAVRNACLTALDKRLPGESVFAMAARLGAVEAEGSAAPDPELTKKHSLDSYGAHFSEVAVHSLTGEVRVRRHVGVFNVGRILSPRQARNQFHGAIIMGLGMALMERNFLEARHGQFVNQGMDEYLVPVNADVPGIEVHWIDTPDPVVNALGSRGAGEIGIVGVAAAVANAVYHATGRRIRDLPITPDKLL